MDVEAFVANVARETGETVSFIAATFCTRRAMERRIEERDITVRYSVMYEIRVWQGSRRICLQSIRPRNPTSTATVLAQIQFRLPSRRSVMVHTTRTVYTSRRMGVTRVQGASGLRGRMTGPATTYRPRLTSRSDRRTGRVAAFLDQAWGVSVDQKTLTETLPQQLFALSIFPYAGFLYHLTKSKQAPKLTLFGFYFLLVFVFATIPAGIYAKKVRPLPSVRGAPVIPRHVAHTLAPTSPGIPNHAGKRRLLARKC